MRRISTFIFVFLATFLIVSNSAFHVANAQVALPGTRCVRFVVQPTPKKVAGKLVQADDGWFGPGTRCTRFVGTSGKKGSIFPNRPPSVRIGALLSDLIVMPSDSGLTLTGLAGGIKVNAFAWDPDGDTLLYTFSTTGGRILGDGSEVTWNLDGSAPGTYTISVEADDGCGCIAFSSGSVMLPERR